MAKRTQEHDWAATPDGPIEEWPASLQTMVELMLASGFPMTILAGLDHDGLLTNREREGLYLSAQGMSYPEIGDRLAISPRTAETYRATVRKH